MEQTNYFQTKAGSDRSVEWPQPAHTAQPSTLEEAGDEELLNIIQGDSPSSQKKEAFHIVYNRYHLDIWRFVSSKTNSECEAKDIFCEVWGVAAKDLPAKFTWTGTSIKSWLLTIANNKIAGISYDQNRNKKIQDVLQYINNVLDLDRVTIDINLEQENKRLLTSAIAKLKSSKQRQIVMLRYYQNKQIKEIAQLLKMNSNAVTKAHTRAIEELRKILEGVKNDI